MEKYGISIDREYTDTNRRQTNWLTFWSPGQDCRGKHWGPTMGRKIPTLEKSRDRKIKDTYLLDTWKIKWIRFPGLYLVPFLLLFRLGIKGQWWESNQLIVQSIKCAKVVKNHLVTSLNSLNLSKKNKKNMQKVIKHNGKSKKDPAFNTESNILEQI